MIFINHKEELDSKVIIVELKGALNSETSVDFEEYVNQLLEKQKIFIILDAKHLESVSSAGIGVILYIQKKILSIRGFFIICNISQEISSLYGILGFDKVIKIAENKDEALKIMIMQINLIENEAREKPASEGNPDIHLETGLQDEYFKKEALEEENFNEMMSDTIFENPIILECSSCKNMIRIKRSGNYICPDCKAEFSVAPDQTVFF